MKKKIPITERRGIYEYVNASGTYHGLCLVIAANHRHLDKYVSGIALSLCEYDDGIHNDEQEVCLPDGRKFWVHCGMVTYFRRDRLGEMIYKISESEMSVINEGIKKELGMNIADEEINYEKLYKDLINSIAEYKKEK